MWRNNGNTKDTTLGNPSNGSGTHPSHEDGGSQGHAGLSIPCPSDDERERLLTAVTASLFQVAAAAAAAITTTAAPSPSTNAPSNPTELRLPSQGLPASPSIGADDHSVSTLGGESCLIAVDIATKDHERNDDTNTMRTIDSLPTDTSTTTFGSTSRTGTVPADSSFSPIKTMAGTGSVLTPDEYKKRVSHKGPYNIKKRYYANTPETVEASPDSITTANATDDVVGSRDGFSPAYSSSLTPPPTMDGVKFDLNTSKFGNRNSDENESDDNDDDDDEEQALDQSSSSKSRNKKKNMSKQGRCTRGYCMLWGVITCLVLIAVIVSVMLLVVGNVKAEPSSSNLLNGGGEGSNPFAPTASIVDPTAPVAPTMAPVEATTPTVSPTIAPTRTQTAIPTASPTLTPTMNVRAQLVDLLGLQDIVVNDQDVSDPANLAVTYLAQEAEARGDLSLDATTTNLDKLRQRFSLLTLDFGLTGATIISPPGAENNNSSSSGDGGGTNNSTVGTDNENGGDDGGNTESDNGDGSDGSGSGGGGFANPFSGNGTAAPESDGTADNGNEDGTGVFLDPFAGSGRRRKLQNDNGGGAIPLMARQNVDECVWPGVLCDIDLKVTHVTLGSQNLPGSIPTEIGWLTSLQYLDLSQNQLQGSIPGSLYNLTALKELYLYQNEITGSISTRIGNLQNLTHLHLSHNRLVGSIPQTMSSGSTIKPYYYVNFHRNQMTGTIPQDLGWRNLYLLDLGHNQFTGTLPIALGERFGSLRHLHLDHNNFVGTLPLSYINVGNGRLEQLTINDNQLTGTVPDDHQMFNKLMMFTIQNNNFGDWLETGTCRLTVFSGGENIELKADCDICSCRNTFACSNC